MYFWKCLFSDNKNEKWYHKSVKYVIFPSKFSSHFAQCILLHISKLWHLSVSDELNVEQKNNTLILLYQILWLKRISELLIKKKKRISESNDSYFFLQLCSSKSCDNGKFRWWGWCTRDEEKTLYFFFWRNY